MNNTVPMITKCSFCKSAYLNQDGSYICKNRNFCTKTERELEELIKKIFGQKNLN